MTRSIRCFNSWILAAFILAGVILAGSAGAQRVTPRQKEQLKSLAMQTRRKSDAQRGNIRRARIALVAACTKYKLDERRVKLSRSSIGAAQLSLLNIHLDNQVGIRRILNPAQFRKFLEMTRKMRKPDMAVMPPGDALMDRIPDRDILKRLGLTPQQAKRAPQLIGPGPEKKKVIDKIRRDSRRMLDLYSNYNLDTAAARRLIDAIHASQVQLAALNHKKQQLIRSVLTESQFQRLQEEIAKRLREHKRRVRR